jgi:amino acid transporter
MIEPKNMHQSKPTSLKLFIIALTITATVFLIVTFNPGYGTVLAFILILTFGLTGVGIYSGLTHKTDERKLKRNNRIGLLGNSLIFLFILSIMVYALYSIN